MTEVYRFSAGRSAAEALDIGGGKPVALGSISKRIKASRAELTGLNERINVLKVRPRVDSSYVCDCCCCLSGDEGKTSPVMCRT